MARSDPKAAGIRWRYGATAGVVVLLLFGVLLPVAGNLLAGYKIGVLEKQREALLRQQYELELEEARLLDPAELARWAGTYGLVDPEPETAILLGPPTDGSLARAQ
jgi:hypothetical protein